uniref:Uncharacterized protein n=1 Tax=Panagrolaimus davidi TaxID=227884 RepID=A0A914Q515_9BILA
MKKLTYLGFDSNQNPLILTNIFPEMNLEILVFSFCGIKTLEEDVFKNLQKLRILLLEGNNLTVIPGTLKYLPNLYQIELGHNLISEIEKNVFLPNPKLSVIVLNNNPKLKFIGDCSFCGLPVLEWVRLSSCHQLSYIHENAFGVISTGKAPNFELFAINECNISVLSENLLDWKNMETLDIGGNPFACNCSMAWLFVDLLSDSSIYDKKIKRRYQGHKYILGCFPPLDTAHKHFFKPLNISEILEPCKNIYSSKAPFWWIFIIAFGFISTIGIYVYHRQLNSIAPNSS